MQREEQVKSIGLKKATRTHTRLIYQLQYKIKMEWFRAIIDYTKPSPEKYTLRHAAWQLQPRAGPLA